MRPPDDPPDSNPPSNGVLDAVRALLLTEGKVLLPPTVEKLRALGDAALGPLLAVLVDTRLRDPQGPGAGWAPVHAANLLRALPAGESRERMVAPLLDVLATTAEQTPLHDAVTRALAPLGSRLVDPILERLPTAVRDYRRELWILLAKARVHEPRVLSQLLRALAEAPEVGARCLAEHGDTKVLPDLARALDAYRGGSELDPPAIQAVLALREAIVQLDGTLTPAQEAIYDRALWSQRRAILSRRGGRREPPDDADAPCPCGSGRPYRLCCLQ